MRAPTPAGALEHPDVKLAVNRRFLTRLDLVSTLRCDWDVDLDLATYQLPERMATEVAARVRLPADVLQDSRVIAEWPATWWDYLKARFGRPHRTRRVLLNEAVIFPTVKLPPFQHGITVSWIEDQREVTP